MLLALFIAAAAPKPPANVIIPEKLRERREQELEGAPQALPFFANPLLTAALGPIQPQPGAWVEYYVRNKGKPDTRVRASVLDQPAADGRYWLEIASASEQGIAAAVKMLVHGDPATAKDVERMFVFLAGQQPLEVPLDQVDMPKKAPPKPPAVKHLRREPLTVRAGTFKAELLQAGDMRVWRAPGEVPLWSLVKAQSPRESVELIGRGRTGAHTVFPAGWGDAKDAQGYGSESTK